MTLKKIFRILFHTCIGAILLIMVIMNIRLRRAPELPYGNKEDLSQPLMQLNYLNAEVHNDLGSRMQLIFPEGYDFTNALYGLSWAAIAENSIDNTEIYPAAIKEAIYAYNYLDSPTGKEPFSANMEPAYGIFYNGWKNYLLANILRVQYPLDSSLLKPFEINCSFIADAFSKNIFPDSYPDNAWPTDACVAIASLALHDKITTPQYEELIKKWIAAVRLKLDASTGLIPHSVVSRTGTTLEPARGSSMALMLIFLSDIDPAFAKELYPVFEKTFLTTRIGLPVLREFPKGNFSGGDIDSGPVIFGVGFSATIVAPGACLRMGEIAAAEKISGVVEACGFATSYDDEKKYLFGKLPVADLFILWSRLQQPAVEVSEESSMGCYYWISLLTLALILLWVWRLVVVFKKSK